MRSATRCIAFLPLVLLVLARPAHADPMDNFSITGNGLSIDFSVPVSTTAIYTEIQDQFQLGPLMGTVNGADATISSNFVTMTPCAVCPAILLSYHVGGTYGNLTLELPSLYEITPASGMDETFTFLTGTYMAATIPIYYGGIYEIQITPETTTTPEPPTLFLFAAAAFGGLLLTRRRAPG
jgi:hypothetical protein